MSTKIIYTGENKELFKKTIEMQSYISNVKLGDIINGVALIYFDMINDRLIYNDFVIALHEVGISTRFVSN